MLYDIAYKYIYIYVYVCVYIYIYISLLLSRGDLGANRSCVSFNKDLAEANPLGFRLYRLSLNDTRNHTPLRPTPPKAEAQKPKTETRASKRSSLSAPNGGAMGAVVLTGPRDGRTTSSTPILLMISILHFP